MLEHGKAKEYTQHTQNLFTPHTLAYFACLDMHGHLGKKKEKKRKENKNAGREHRIKGGMGRFPFKSPIVHCLGQSLCMQQKHTPHIAQKDNPQCHSWHKRAACLPSLFLFLRWRDEISKMVPAPIGDSTFLFDVFFHSVALFSFLFFFFGILFPLHHPTFSHHFLPLLRHKTSSSFLLPHSAPFTIDASVNKPDLHMSASLLLEMLRHSGLEHYYPRYAPSLSSYALSQQKKPSFYQIDNHSTLSGLFE